MMKFHHLALAVSLGMLGVCTSAQPIILNKASASPELQAEHWYSVKALGEESGAPKTIEVYIYGEIGFWGITSANFIEDLKAVDDGVSPVLVHFDTIGGDLFDGIAIHNTLRALGERCTARIDGACFSAGSVAACGAHRVEMANNALFMIHNPWTLAAGDAEDLRKLADMMDKAAEGIVASYQHRPLTIDDATLRQLISDETWMTAAEAKTYGFVDEILGAGEPVAMNASLGKVLNRYRNTPAAARALLENQGPAPADPPANDPPADPPLSAEAAELAAELTAECAKAGLADCASHLIKASGLKSREAVHAQLDRAKAVKAVCLVANLPEEAQALIESGVDADGARLKLYDKIVARSSQVEIHNKTPLDDDPMSSTGDSLNPGDIYARRRTNASKGAHQ
ncbi:head maturation protease, ClpP-related [Pseudomonas panipatensis]|uniref:ATP-dependent protease ClpP, protease subunit n=1 Tax=Pseudomonas panipatensis TaxID=428992 RepID=A0A1G8CVA7_9PSED|nr:head maturation protease, ClpP-related [Pseudomonas panipatensis]SDH49398.1 ATP-dependent protease ClpP, protease subunit [Pseudomonas panipatensis]SMP63371.1 ATP-dependent protease ClpP, protease subunit [Pseudomonas panipatensis]